MRESLDMSDKDARLGGQAGFGLPSPELIHQETDYASRYLVVTKNLKRMPNGQEATFYLRQESDVAVCLPVTREGRFVMVEEYRHGPGRWLFEIPGGDVEKDERAEMAVAREVQEETGYTGEVFHLCTTWISAYSNARKHIYLMLNAEKVAIPEMADADLFRVAEISRDELDRVLTAGALTDLDAGLACLKKLDLMKVA
jgi:ADP-ribose pyrophosphatase